MDIKSPFKENMLGLIQKEKLDILGEKSVQIFIVTKACSTRMTQDYDYGVQTHNNCNNFVVFSLLCSYYVNDIIKKLQFHLLVVIILFKTEFGHAQKTVPKIGKLVLKTACFNP